MKSCVKVGFYSVGIYLIIFLFNYFFVRSVESNVALAVVAAPVYFILEIFGVFGFGVYFVAGILFYFVLGALIDISFKFLTGKYHKVFDS